MKNLIKWEMKQTLTSKLFIGLSIAFILGSVAFTLTPLLTGSHIGYELFLQGLGNTNSLIVLLVGIFAGIHVTGALEGRRIQSAVMAGNSRFQVVLTKLISFALSVAVFSIGSLTASSVIAFVGCGFTGLEGSFFSDVIVKILLYVCIEVSFAGICFFISLMIKNVGASIAVNLISMLVLNGVGQYLVGQAWAAPILKFTSLGQTFLLIGDGSPANLVPAVIAAVTGVVFILVISYLKLRKEELK